MEVLHKISANLERLNTSGILFKAMSENPILSKLAIQLNQENQLQHGLTANDGFLGNYSKASVEVFGKSPGPIQLKDTGAFYDSFHVVLSEDGFIINADGEKDGENLFVKYGQDITGLDETSLAIFRSRLIPYVRKIIINEILKGV